MLPLFVAMLWRPGEPPVLLLAVLSQWAQVFVPVLEANLAGIRLGDDVGLPEFAPAAWLGLAAVLVLAAGMRVGSGRGAESDASATAWLERVSVGRLALLYAGAYGLSLALPAIVSLVPAIRQPLSALGLLRWTAAFVIFWGAGRRRDLLPLALAVMIAETVVGFGGYFSGFKFVYYLAAAVLLATPARGALAAWLGAALVGVVTFGLTVYWQAVKVDYRSYLSGGEAAQAVTVSPSDRFQFLFERTGKLETSDLMRGLESGMKRLGYLEYFARAVRTVPDQMPYQGGRLWGEALVHLVTPRALFPDKQDINDSERTNAFCGMRVANAEQGTSVSIGYAGESYIDFGPIGMFIPILLLGVFWGWAFRWLASCSPVRTLGVAVGSVLVLSGASLFESSNIKIVGGAVTNLIVWTVLLRLGGRPLARYLTPSRRDA